VYGVGEEDRGDAGGFGGLDRVGNYIPTRFPIASWVGLYLLFGLE
jgi:hypothetical protein